MPREDEDNMSIRKFGPNALIGAVLALCALGTQANPTMTLTSQIGGDYVSTNLYSGTGGGGYSGTLTNAGAHDQNPLLTYCIELNQFFSWGSYTDYSIVSAASQLGAIKAGRLANLFTWALTDSSTWFSDKDKSSGVQLAVWEIVYENAAPLNLASGDFMTTGTGTNAAALADANLLLGHANTPQLNAQAMWILASPSHQDQLFWESANGRQTTDATVPEPTSLALAALAFAGMALTRRPSRAAPISDPQRGTGRRA